MAPSSSTAAWTTRSRSAGSASSSATSRISSSASRPSRRRSCLPRELPDGENRLVAYLVAHAGSATDTATAAVRDAMSATAPAYMVPARCVWLPQFPLLPNGKLDRAGLARLALVEDAAAPAEPREPDRGDDRRAVEGDPRTAVDRRRRQLRRPRRRLAVVHRGVRAGRDAARAIAGSLGAAVDPPARASEPSQARLVDASRFVRAAPRDLDRRGRRRALRPARPAGLGPRAVRRVGHELRQVPRSAGATERACLADLSARHEDRGTGRALHDLHQHRLPPPEVARPADDQRTSSVPTPRSAASGSGSSTCSPRASCSSRCCSRSRAYASSSSRDPFAFALGATALFDVIAKLAPLLWDHVAPLRSRAAAPPRRDLSSAGRSFTPTRCRASSWSAPPRC